MNIRQKNIVDFYLSTNLYFIIDEYILWTEQISGLLEREFVKEFGRSGTHILKNKDGRVKIHFRVENGTVFVSDIE